ncbi:hypothetical protein CCR97_08140 [Rhodoplanes elegans]|uniref:ParB-like N-terminal domain-containing protein n=1 Tax=Rhodoplanes elegans TaxID=29408 RepID=A0A327KVF9_9BRAD|nr:ParB N-terminal domain-containing protein [Rhodoplanes elegans]MBK5958089.1 hypothetical protein [Rhodoplanes elegans]MBK5958181.1 hypothetical protein [Rhodoplanes elegans]RAI41964.1 hypothetical protein CH338_01280 [Rhodoplanes elegans]
MKLDNIEVSAVIVPPGRREPNMARVREIAESIRRVGLLQPIVVREQAHGYKLIAGRHRLAAVTLLEEPFIDAFLFKGDDIGQRLAEITENLHRADLTALERDEQLAEWIRLTEAQQVQSFQSETIESKRVDGKGHRQEGGVNAAARDLGVSKADAHRAMKVSTLSESAKQAARDVGLDNNRTALLKAAAVPVDRQAEAIRQEAEARKKDNKARNEIIRDDHTEEFAEWLYQHGGQELPSLISWLEVCKPKEVIEALRRISRGAAA